jgi:demethylmenaquinone methyltransferase/2-methoxy-6-polyprenyl-1,4-benzoquinol methylase
VAAIDRKHITADEEKYYSLSDTVFKAWAPFYDFFVRPVSKARENVVGLTGAAKSSKVLDVATGTGAQALAFAKRGYDTIGVDLSEAMLKVAHRKNRYPNARFEVADATHLRFEDNSFDVSTISFALHDMPITIREKVLKEMVRVTKPEGIVVIVDYALPKNRIGRFLTYRLVLLYEAEYYKTFIESDVEALLRRIGIRIQAELPILLGGGRILKGINAKTIASPKADAPTGAQVVVT